MCILNCVLFLDVKLYHFVRIIAIITSITTIFTIIIIIITIFAIVITLLLQTYDILDNE